ncbi:kinesin-like protein [Achlya hypogyna]|uniref:Kinesin-like protein n=1 Tax=Achlya hypogyna TaxID=1202772 RepID=A0A1V9YHJ3_ACHHY|nr:kinesin-like protein [Achlya hypogyna]
MDEEIAALRRELESAKDDLFLKTDDYDQLVQASSQIEAELEKALDDAEEAATKWRFTAERLETELADTKEKLVVSIQDAANVQTELDKYKEQATTLAAEKMTWETDMDRLTTQVRILEASTNDLRHQLDRALEDKVFLQNDYDEIEKEHELTTERFRTEILDLKSELFALQLHQKAGENPAIASPLLPTSPSSSFENDSLEDLDEHDDEGYNHGNQEDDEDLEEPEDGLADEEDDQDMLLSPDSDTPLRHISSADRDAEESERQIVILEEEMEELARRLQEEEDRRMELEEELVELRDNEAHIQAMETEISEMSDELIEKALMIKQTESEVERLQGELATMEATLVSTKEEFAAAQTQLQTLQSFQDDHANYVALEASMQTLQAECDRIKELNDQLHAKLETERQRQAMLVQELESSKTSFESLQTQFEELMEKYEGVQQDLEKSRHANAMATPSQQIEGEIAQKYVLERRRNAALLSRLQNLTGNIQVFCRVRPLLARDPRVSHTVPLAVDVLSITDVAALELKTESVFDDHSATAAAPWKMFTFDRVLGQHDSQLDVFREVEPVAQAVVDGFKACIFAYGQTGSGKTYTMEGSPDQPGLNQRLLAHLYDSLSLRGVVVADAAGAGTFAAPPSNHETMYMVNLGVFEIYNENIRDLLEPDNPPLQIHTDGDTGEVCLPQLTMEAAYSPTHALGLLAQAQKHRATSRTNVHDRSSRSHCVVVINVKSTTGLRGTLYLVDLAGSERVKVSGVDGDALKETAAINKSLSALGDVMEALDRKSPHIPYRNSKLTYALQDVLGGGQSKTVMILNVAPGFSTASETYRSMQFAERVRRVDIQGLKPKNSKSLISGKQAFTEIKSLKQQLSVANTKIMQGNQSIATMKREHKHQLDKITALVESRTKALEDLKGAMATLKTSNATMAEKWKQEREARQQEGSHADMEQRQRRQWQSKSTVTMAHQESLAKQLQAREQEIAKLRQNLNEARRRTTAKLMPRLSMEKSTPPPKARSAGNSPLEPFKRMTLGSRTSSTTCSSGTETDSDGRGTIASLAMRAIQAAKKAAANRRVTLPQDEAAKRKRPSVPSTPTRSSLTTSTSARTPLTTSRSTKMARRDEPGIQRRASTSSASSASRTSLTSVSSTSSNAPPRRSSSAATPPKRGTWK